MYIKVLLAGDWSRNAAESLKDRLHAAVEVTTEIARCDWNVIVSGRPDEELLKYPSVTHLLIPFAGLPASTARLMEKYGHISVHNIHHNAAAASELAIGLMLAAARRIIPADSGLRDGDWSCRYRQEKAVLVQGSRVLIMGLGAIGSRIAFTCNAMGAEVLAVRHDPSSSGDIPDVDVHPPEALHSLLGRTDILFLALPLTPATENIIGDEELSLMHSRSVLVNVGRGGLVDPMALFRHLRDGGIGSAGIDVWYSYPSRDGGHDPCRPAPADFASLDNVVMTPHLGGAFGSPYLEELRLEHLARSISSLAEKGEMPHRIDLKRGY